MQIEDVGKHLLGAEDLAQKHSLLEGDANVLGERVRLMIEQARTFIEIAAPPEGAPDLLAGYRPAPAEVIDDRIQLLENSYGFFILNKFQTVAKANELLGEI